MTMFLLQRRAPDGNREVLASIGGETRTVRGVRSTRDLAEKAIASGRKLREIAEQCGFGEPVDTVAELEAGRLLAPIDHPDPAHLTLAGTGLTHLGSAEGRDQMHKAQANGWATDSMRMFLDGLEGGKPSPGAVGQQPEWFWKGDGQHLAAPEAELTLPSYASDGGEEPEIAGVYLIGPDGLPYRLGICLANEYSDHVTEKHNYLWLAHSKLRQASLGPELLVGEIPDDIRGSARIRRAGAVAWKKPFLTGETNMAHTIANLEHHHFKYDLFRRPGDIHVHFFGTSTASFADGFSTCDGDIFEIEASPFTLPLRNRLSSELGNEKAVEAIAL